MNEIDSIWIWAKCFVAAMLIAACASCSRGGNAAPAAAASTEPQPRFYCDPTGNLVEDSGAKQQTLIAKAGFFVNASGSGGNYYGVLCFQGGIESIKIFRCAADGSLNDAAEIKDDQFEPVLHIDSMIILPNGHLFIDGEINPSLGLGTDIDDASGKHQCFLGFGFIWNANATSVAYFRDMQDIPAKIPEEVWANGRAIAKIPRHQHNQLAWEADGHTLDVKIEKGKTMKINTITAPTIESNFGN